LQFLGTMSIGQAEGFFQYDFNAEPFQINRGTLNNAIYHLSSYEMVVTSTREDILPSASFSQAMPDVTADWCIGICLASVRRMAILTVKDGSGFGLQFAFELLSESNLPPSKSQIGPFVQAVYGQLGSVPIAVFLTGSLTQAEADISKQEEGQP